MSVAMPAPNAFDYFAIQNTVSRYCFALDTKDWALLRNVVTDDIHADYPFNNNIMGVESLEEKIKHRLRNITSQHAITTQHIEVDGSGRSAKATSYFTAVHFGQGKWKGQEVTAWGMYVDDVMCVDGEGSIPGASGRWLIFKRKVLFMGRIGEERVVDGEEG